MDNFQGNNLNWGDYNYPHQPASKIRKAVGFAWELTKICLISLAIILPIRYFVFQPFYVNGASMEPNFYDHEYLIIDEFSYHFSEPDRGEIVIFKYPKDFNQYFIKRVIGLPGEEVKITDGGVYLKKKGQNEFHLLKESYLPVVTETSLPLRGYGRIKLAADEYFLLGDNRSQSLDSRSFGPVKREFIIGRTWLRGWPLTRLTVFNSPEYSF